MYVSVIYRYAFELRSEVTEKDQPEYLEGDPNTAVDKLTL